MLIFWDNHLKNIILSIPRNEVKLFRVNFLAILPRYEITLFNIHVTRKKIVPCEFDILIQPSQNAKTEILFIPRNEVRPFRVKLLAIFPRCVHVYIVK